MIDYTTVKQDTIKVFNQTILTFLIVIVPVFISLLVNSTSDKIVDILIVFIFGIPILIRLIVYTVNN
jgi:hypothetical protein